MKVLIIGSKGFIGSHAAVFFKQKGNEVWTCDIVNDYNSQNYYQIDTTNSDFKSVFKHNDYDVCINCSGAASVSLSLKNPLKDYNLNTVNVFRILEAIRLFQPQCKFVNFSSAAVYGNPELLPINESQSTKPVSPYGQHKLQSEQICKEFNTHFNIQTCSLRIFSAFGEGLKKQLFWDLFQKMRASNIVELYGTGKETRDFIYISDLIQAIECVILNASFENNIINVGNGEEIHIDEVAQIFGEFFEEDKEIIFNNKVKKGDPLYWKADIEALKSLGYKREFVIKEGLKNYYNWVSLV